MSESMNHTVAGSTKGFSSLALQGGEDVKAHIHITQVSVSYLPADHPDHVLFEVLVESRDLVNDRWAVLRHGRCLGRDGKWEYEPIPSNRENDWLAEHRFGYDEALALAVEAAAVLKVNGRTVQDVSYELHGC